jgi:hypothetical protein
MSARNLPVGLFAAFAVAMLSATGAQGLQVKVSINFGPTIVGPDNGTLIVAANPGDFLRITWALGTDTGIDVYRGLVSGVDTTELTRDVGSALELTGQGFDPLGNPNVPFPGEFGYNAWSDGAPIGFAGNGGELWRIEYLVTNPVTDSAADISFRFDDVFQCQAFPGGSCPGTPGSASLRVDAVPEPNTLLLLGSSLASLARLRGRRTTSACSGHRPAFPEWTRNTSPAAARCSRGCALPDMRLRAG